MAKHANTAPAATPAQQAMVVTSTPQAQGEKPAPAPADAPKPYVGAMVHYTAGSNGNHAIPRAAIITGVYGQKKFDAEGRPFALQVDLTVFFPNAQPWVVSCVPFSVEPKAGCWSWPLRVG